MQNREGEVSGNPNYRKGRRAEYEVMDLLKEQGYTCVRTAGSHGRWDVIAVIPNDNKHGANGHSLWIQVKAGSKKFLDKEHKLFYATLMSMPVGHHELLICKEKNKGLLNNPDLPFLLTSKRKKS